MEEEAKFCPSCGAGVNGQQSQNSQSGNFQETINKYMQTDDNTSEFEQEDINQLNVAVLLDRLDTYGSENFKIDKDEEFNDEWKVLTESREEYYKKASKVLLKDL